MQRQKPDMPRASSESPLQDSSAKSDDPQCQLQSCRMACIRELHDRSSSKGKTSSRVLRISGLERVPRFLCRHGKEIEAKLEAARAKESAAAAHKREAESVAEALQQQQDALEEQLEASAAAQREAAVAKEKAAQVGKVLLQQHVCEIHESCHAYLAKEETSSE